MKEIRDRLINLTIVITIFYCYKLPVCSSSTAPTTRSATVDQVGAPDMSSLSVKQAGSWWTTQDLDRFICLKIKSRKVAGSKTRIEATTKIEKEILAYNSR